MAKKKEKKEMSNKEKAQELRTLFIALNDSRRQKWLKDNQQGYDFSLGDQLTETQKEELESAGMPTFTINMITPAIELMIYFATANNPRWIAVGVDGSDSDVAQIHSDVADYDWYCSGGKSIYAQVIKDALTKSKGYFLLAVDPNADRGMGEVRFYWINPFHVYTDVASKDMMERDAGVIMIKNDIAKSILKTRLSQFIEEIDKATGGADGIRYSDKSDEYSMSNQPEDILATVNSGIWDTKEGGSADEVIGYYECYRKIMVPYMNVFIIIPPNKEEMKEVKKIVEIQLVELKKELEVQFLQTKKDLNKVVGEGDMIQERMDLELEKLAKEHSQILAQQAQVMLSKAKEEASKMDKRIMAEKEYEELIKNPEIKKHITEAIPFQETKIKLTVSCGTETFLYEKILDMRDYPIIKLPYIHTGTVNDMSAVVPLVGKQQEINKAHQIMIHNANIGSNLRYMAKEGQVDEEEWQKWGSVANAILTWEDIDGSNQPPIPIQPLPLSNAFYSIVEKGQVDIQHMSGMQGSLGGEASDQPETYRGMLANDEFGTRRMRQWMNNVVEPVLEHLGRVHQQIAQKHYTVHKVFRLVQPSGAGFEEREQEVNRPLYNDFGKVIGKYQDYETAKFDTRIIAGSTLPLNRWALLEEYFRWLQEGVITRRAFLAQTDVRNKEEILKEIGEIEQLQQQVAQLQDALKSKDGDLQTYHRQLLQKNLETDSLKLGAEGKRDFLETESKQKYMQKELDGMLKLAKEKIAVGTEKILNNIKAKEEKKSK